jgi:hypothetical protein
MYTIAYFYILLLGVWHIYPREDYTNTWYMGPHSIKDCWCAVDLVGRAYVNDLPKCLMVLQDIDRLDLAQEFIEVDQKKLR